MNVRDAAASGDPDAADALAVPEGRRAQIVAQLTGTGLVSVATLSGRFGVSRDTIRRDLDQLADEGRLQRTRGGAMRIAPKQVAGDHVAVEFTTAKETVGALAAGLVQDDSVIMVNAGATPAAMARQLSDRRGLTIVTNNLLLAAAIPVEACRSMYLLGGEVRLSGQSTTGSVERQLSGSGLDVRCDLALISIGGVSVERGYSTGDLAEAQMMHEMMRRATKVAVLADSTKFGRQLFANIANLGEADYFVTDATPPMALRDALLARDVQILTPQSVR